MGKKAIIHLILFLISHAIVFGQEIRVNGKFLKDTVKVGEEIPYSMWAWYPYDQDIIFSDSTYDYSPFEYVSRTYFPTRTDSLVSFDSVVYKLTTFEIDSIQYLQVPVFAKQVEDSTSIYPALDSIILEHVIKELPDSIDFRENTAFLYVPGEINYPVILFAAAVLIILIVLVVLIFGKKIARKYRVWLMTRRHRKFVDRFAGKLNILKKGKNGIKPEIILNDWKNYMESLEREPYTKLTTKELISLHADQRLKENLRSIDRYIYGSLTDRPLYENFEKLLDFSRERYELRKEEVSHG